MCTSSQKSASSSTSSKQYISTPSTSSKTKSTSSSTSRKVQDGSRIPHHSSSSSATSSPTSSSRSSHKDPASQRFQGEAINRYENEPRDYKSWTVEEYDAYQEKAKGEHWDDVERNVEGVKWAS
ncbi:predicted protein [Sclerotinia sclerotiorum 1980 UF-70]|uniref:Uncharacterized protein n=2 Tax=Sclerotinia sclerotiorum (strain ATCC 18683 / 1980 / Ss-1) TaxID=665079 RepID=A7EHC2_SCLS1|nr:predicted protein [Sclerotinia sclerotiorum 1980 UF-70]APA06700.1 hypothetical protein sscle_02g014700 [Sclerotinia sclerotiorum 1980 UF-70]EDO02238.1 predicted protein [Sclerotinia sclerotiorum 1980 UF-70]